MNPENSENLTPGARRPVFRTRISRAKEASKTFFAFVATQIFFAGMILGFSYGGEIVFGMLIAIPPIILIMLGRKDSYLLLLYFACISFAVGQRTIYIGPSIRFVPGDIIMIGLFAVCAFMKPRHFYKKAPLPLVLVLMNILIILYIQTEDIWIHKNFASFGRSIGYCKMMWMSIPCFFVMWHLITRADQVRTIFTIFAMESFFLCLLALSEYFNFGFVKFFGGFLSHHEDFSQEGFRRLGAYFWGGPSLAAFITILFPLQLSQWFVSRTLTQKVIVGSSLILSLLVIYYSGHRGMWIAVTVGLICYFTSKGAKGLIMLMLLFGAIVLIVPQKGVDRIESLYGKHRDTSSKKREDRAREAWELIKHNPFGNGWGASGLVHSDILQLSADAGVAAGAAFLFTYFQVFLRLHRKKNSIKDKTLKEYSFGLIASIVAIFIMLWTQAFFNLPEQYILIWFITGLAYQFPNIVLTEMRVAQEQKT